MTRKRTSSSSTWRASCAAGPSSRRPEPRRCGKPVLACLGGQTETGRQATRSHTGSLAGFRALDRAALRQAGVWIASDPVELLEAARVFSLCPTPAGGRVLVVTASGSLGVMAADRLEREGLEMASLDPRSLAALEARVPAWMNLGNPLDVGPSGLFREALNAGLAAKEVDAILAFPIIPWAVVSPLLRSDPSGVAGLFLDRPKLEAALDVKPVLLCAPGHPEWQEACEGFFGPRVPFVSSPPSGARLLGALCGRADWLRSQQG